PAPPVTTNTPDTPAIVSPAAGAAVGPAGAQRGSRACDDGGNDRASSLKRRNRPFTLSPAVGAGNPDAAAGGPVRFFVAMVSHETNTFSPIPTDRRQFEAHDLRYGGEILEAYRGTGTCVGGMIDGAAARGVTLVPSLAAGASPA